LKRFAIALLAMLSVTPASAETFCVITTQDHFIERMQKTAQPLELLMATKETREAFLKTLNEKRAAKDLWAIEADTFLIGKRPIGVGMVMFKDGCVVPGTIQMVSYETFELFNFPEKGFTHYELSDPL
jgi:hypothetical protein